MSPFITLQEALFISGGSRPSRSRIIHLRLPADGSLRKLGGERRNEAAGSPSDEGNAGHDVGRCAFLSREWLSAPSAWAVLPEKFPRALKEECGGTRRRGVFLHRAWPRLPLALAL
jgi:hypothetical protein